MKKLYLIIILLFIPTWLIAGNWNNSDSTTEKVMISKGIYNVITTHTSGEVEEKIMMKIKGVAGMFEVEFVDGEYKLTEEGIKEKDKAIMRAAGGC